MSFFATEPHQRLDGNWVYRAERTETEQAREEYASTFIQSKGGRLRFKYRKSATAQLSIYVGNQRKWHRQSAVEEGKDHEVYLDLPAGAQTITFRFYGSNPGDWVEIDDIVFPGVADSDNDGVADAAEHIHYRSLTTYSAAILGLMDSDLDGLTDLQEIQLGSEPKFQDSDADGMPDNWEHEHGLPLTFNNAAQDQDGDGVSDVEEWFQGSDPIISDNTQRLVMDFNDKSTKGFYFWPRDDQTKYRTDKIVGDIWRRIQKPDGNWIYRAEFKEGSTQTWIKSSTFATFKGKKLTFKYRKAPNTQFGVCTPICSDGYTDHGSAEVLEFKNVEVDVSKENHEVIFYINAKPGSWAEIDDVLIPGNADSDADGISDSFEYITYGNTIIHDEETIKYLDTDQDGLTDLQEMALGSNALHIDSDADGISDYEEYLNNTSPITANE